MRKLIAKITLGMLFLAMISISLPANAQDPVWKIEITPYLWFAGIDADIKAGGKKGSVDVGFDDLVDYVDIAGGLLVITEMNRWLIWVQGDFMALESDKKKTKFDERGKLESDLTIIEAAFGYSFDNPLSARGRLDALIGFRYTDIENKFKPSAGGSFSSDNDFWDLMLVLRPSFPITERLFFNPTLAIGAGDSDLIYELQPQFEYKFTDYIAGRIGYRRLYYDIKGDRGEFDGALHGLIVGLGVTF
jgi:hypothetical protein